MSTPPHRRHRRPALLGALCLALGLPTLTAEAAGPPVTGLAQRVEQAWQRHPQTAGQNAREAQEQAARDAAHALTPEPPSVSLGHLDDRLGRDTGRQEWEVELAVPLWWPGQKSARLAQADGRTAQVATGHLADRLLVAGEVREAWWSLALARSAHDLASRRLDTAQALNLEVQKRFQAGDLSRMDAHQARGEVLAAEAERLASATTRHQAEQAFRLLTGSDAPATLDDETIAESAQAEVTAGSAVSDRHPLIAAAAAASRSAWAQLTVADKTRRAAPELSVRLVRERGDFAEPYGNSVGIKLRIPFSSGPQVRQERSAALADAEKADAQRLWTEMQVNQDIERARQALAVGTQRLRMARERVALSADTLSLAEKAFRLGESDLSTLLRIRAADVEAQADAERQRIAHAAAISRWNQSLGVLP